ncbi:hypothetical protein K469DRAFT_671176 [Zopfia rhizophila CBS 207.26]|uniref:Fungal N-terminal domain-containing protein n=1 Tax=Zopfia rhizophila CBS 207.26 TaxID=1314779 RepID=A0A6A6DV75_9PEZI|nr:hypothetical protein K469DRAFT_671176 [Zopfia rhizophila CBS 207.26]
MAAIPSIGDILMLSQLAWKIGRAFTAGRKGAPVEFLEVETEINRLAKALKLLAETLFADADNKVLSQTDKETQVGVATILLSCQRTVNDLDSLIDQYQVIKKQRTPGGFAIDRSWSDLVLHSYKTMMWTTEGGNIQNLRNILQVHTSTITLVMQALQSKSLSRLRSIVTPMAEKIDSIHQRTGSLSEQLEEVHRIVVDIAGRTPPLPPRLRAARDPDSRPPSSLHLDTSHQATPSSESFPAQEYFPPRSSSKPTATQSPEITTSEIPTSETSTKRVSCFSFEASSRYSGSYPPSETGTSTNWPSPVASRLSTAKKEATLPRTPEIHESQANPNRTSMPPLPPPAMDVLPDPGIEKAMSMSKLSLKSGSGGDSPDIKKLHRSSMTAGQRELFEKAAFRNSAVLCDVRGLLVEYTLKLNEETPSDPFGVEMVEACKECRITVVRKRESIDNETKMMTSIWVFSDDNTVRLQQRLAEGEMYVPYSSYFSPEKISITVPCEIKYHDMVYGKKPVKRARTSWINYVFEDGKSSTLFQNELMGRALLGTYRTEKTLRIHEGFSGAFSYQEQMCGMENLRIWEDESTAAVVALIHFSAHFRMGYLAFYLNDSANPIKVKDEGGREVKIKGLRVLLDGGRWVRKDSAVAGAGGEDVEGRGGKRGSKEVDKRKVVSGARIEFASEGEKKDFLGLVREVQKEMRELPELVGV